MLAAQLSFLLKKLQYLLYIFLNELVNTHVVEKLELMKEIGLAYSFVLVFIEQVEEYGFAILVIFSYELVYAIAIFFMINLELEVVEFSFYDVV